jgi:hypothetical protein
MSLLIFLVYIIKLICVFHIYAKNAKKLADFSPKITRNHKVFLVIFAHFPREFLEKRDFFELF